MMERNPAADVRPDVSADVDVDVNADATDRLDPGLMLSPAARLLWRSPTCVHLELGERAVVVDGLPADLVRAVATSAPSRARPRSAPRRPPVEQSRAMSPAHAVGPAHAAGPAHAVGPARDALRELVDAGFLWPRPRGAQDERLRPPAPHLAAELTSLAARRGVAAARVLGARHRARVAVHGSSRLAPQLAAVLAAAGVGRVHCVAAGDVHLHATAPGGVTPSDEGQPLAVAAVEAVRRAAPSVDTSAPHPNDPADLTVLAVDGPVSDERRRALHAAEAPYLVVGVSVDRGVVGPLVVPGLSSCLRCADLHRHDRDPAWTALSVQLTIGQRHGPASSVAVSTMVAGAAAIQALAFLDGEPAAAVNATLEVRLPDWRLRRRSWPMHAECDCAPPAQGAAPPALAAE